MWPFTRTKAKLRTRAYEAAGGGRRWENGWRTGGTVAHDTLQASRSVRDRARHAVQNSPWMASGVGAIVTYAAGTGLLATSQHADAATRDTLDGGFSAWAAGADLDGRQDFAGVTANVVRSVVVDGEAFVLLDSSSGRLRLRQIAPEQVDASDNRQLANGAAVIGAIEFDATGQRVAYHVSPARPVDMIGSYLPPIRVPAEDVLHVFRPDGPGQVRGVSWLAPVLLRLADLDQLEDALLVGAKVSAMHAGFLTDEQGTTAGDFPFEGDQRGGLLESGLEPGTLKFLPPGFKLQFNSPAQAQQLVEFAQLQLRAIAAGLGVPEHLLTGDLRSANYSSLRAGLVAFRQRVEQLQFLTLVPQFLNPIWRRWLTVEVLSGRTGLDDFESSTSDYFNVEWIPPAIPWVDPLKDAQATVAMLEAGLMSRRQAVAGLGYSLAALDREIAADRQPAQQASAEGGA